MKSDERTCPECGSTIKKEADVCPYCGHRFRGSASSDGPRNETEKKVSRYSKIGCGVVVVALIALIATCDLPDAPSSGTGEAEAAAADEEDGSLSRSEQSTIVAMSRDGVKSRLRDPSSARFRNVGYYSGGESSAVCGEVNAKNGFGGYTGFERFVALGDKLAFLESDIEASEFADVWRRLCVKADSDEVQIP